MNNQILIDDNMQYGYETFESNEYSHTLKIWDVVYDVILSEMNKNHFSSLSQFDQNNDLTQLATNWILDYDDCLENLILKTEDGDLKKTYVKKRQEVLLQIIEDDEADFENIRSSKRFYAETFYLLGDQVTGENHFKSLIQNDPTYVWYYIGYADQYSLYNGQPKNHKKALQILNKAYKSNIKDDIDAVIERMAAIETKLSASEYNRYLDELRNGDIEDDINSIINTIGLTERKLYKSRMLYLKEHQEIAKPILDKYLDEYLEDPLLYLEKQPFYAFYLPILYAEWQDKSVFEKLVKYIAYDSDLVDNTIGDLQTESFDNILYNCFNGNVDILKKYIKKDISEFSINCYISVLCAVLIDQNRIDELNEYLLQLIKDQPQVLDMLTLTLLAEKHPDLRELALTCTKSKYYNDRIAGTKAEYLHSYDNESTMNNIRKPIDAISLLTGWYYFKEDVPRIIDYNQRIITLTQSRELFQNINQRISHKIGRNDPCPC